MKDKKSESEASTKKTSVTLAGKVEKVIPGVVPAMPEKAQIAVEGAEDLYKEIRVENKLQDENGKPVALKPGAEVEVTIEAEKTATTPKENQTDGKNAPDE
jgi:DNA repair exonuclease SbcCD nuclease subunit